MPPPSRVLRRLLPTVVAAGLLAVLVWRVSERSFVAALAEGPYLALGAFVVVEVIVALLLDAVATWQALAVVGVARRLREVVWVRGATFLAGLLHSSLSHGALAVWVGRSGAGAATAAGVTAFLLLTSALAQLAVVVAVSPAALARSPAGLSIVLAAAAAALAYGAVLALRRGWLTRWPVSRVLGEAGWGGHVRAAAARLPQVVALVVLNWIAFRLWGLPVPFTAALIWMPLVIFVASLPLTPAALGTTQAVQVLFFSAYAAGAGAAEREAAVLAFSLAHHGLYLAVQALVGFVCLARWRTLAGSAAEGPQRG